MTHDGQTASAARSLRLSNFQHHGQPLGLDWEWPAHAQQLGFDEVMVSIGDVEVGARLAQMGHCQIMRTGSDSQWIWWLRMDSPEIACRVNGQRLLAGQQMRLGHGDEVVLGLTQFSVELDAAPPQWTARGAAEQSAANAVLDKFELTELDALMDTTKLSAAELEALDRSAFGDLISLNPEEKPALAQDATPPASAALASAPLQPPAVPAAASVPETPTAEKSPNPLDALYAEYLLRLRHPDQVEDKHKLWRDVVRRDQFIDSDPLQDLMDAAGSQPGLDDLLGQSPSIDPVLAGLDTLNPSSLLDPEPFDDVIKLFAPVQARVGGVDDATSSIETLVQRSLPGLTRREHHSMSLDSAMPLFRSEKPSGTAS